MYKHTLTHIHPYVILEIFVAPLLQIVAPPGAGNRENTVIED